MNTNNIPNIKKIINGISPLFIVGVNYSGKKYCAKYLMSKYYQYFRIAKQFTSDFDLVKTNSDFYIYYGENEFKSSIDNGETLTYNQNLQEKLNETETKAKATNNSNSYEYSGLMKQPLQDMIEKGIPLIIPLDYVQFEQIHKKKHFLSYHSIHLIPFSPELLAEKYYYLKYSDLLKKVNEDSVYEKIVKDVEKAGAMIEYYKDRFSFDVEITNDYSRCLIGDLEKAIDIFYPYFNNTSTKGI